MDDILIDGALYRQVAAPGGVVRRVGRALQLDPSLYREVAAPGASTWQAVLVVVLTAGIAGVGWGAGALHLLVTGEPAVRWMQQVVAEISTVSAVSVFAHVAAWPVWTAGLWVFGRRFAPPSRSLGFWQVARVLAFAQAPGLCAVLIPIAAGAFWLARVDPRVDEGSTLGLLVFAVRAVVGVWVLLGTFLATHEALRLSYGRTLGALVAVAAGIGLLSVLLGIIVTWEFGSQRAAWVDSLASPSVFDVSRGLDFNLGLSFSDAVVNYLIRLVDHARL